MQTWKQSSLPSLPKTILLQRSKVHRHHPLLSKLRHRQLLPLRTMRRLLQRQLTQGSTSMLSNVCSMKIRRRLLMTHLLKTTPFSLSSMRSKAPTPDSHPRKVLLPLLLLRLLLRQRIVPLQAIQRRRSHQVLPSLQLYKNWMLGKMRDMHLNIFVKKLELLGYYLVHIYEYLYGSNHLSII